MNDGNNLNKGIIIDDNALFVYLSIIFFDRFCKSEKKYSSLYSHNYGKPPEWSRRDLLSFLIEIIEYYDLELSEIEFMASAHKESLLALETKDAVEYELKPGGPYASSEIHQDTTDFIRKFASGTDIKLPQTKEEYVELLNDMYSSIYLWWLDYSHKTETQNQISDVISDFIHTEDLNISKLKNMLECADKLSGKTNTGADQHLGGLEEGHDHMFYKMINSIIEHTFIEIESDSSGLNKMKKDFFEYIKNFENNQLKNVAYKKYLTAGLVTNPENICTYEKHAEVFEELLADQAERYGKSFVARNTFYNPVNANEFCELNIFSRYKQRDFLFFHTLFSFFKSGKFSNIWTGTDAGLNGPPSEYKCHIHLTDDYYHSLVEADMRVESIDLDTANITYNKENNRLEIGGFLIDFSNHGIAQRVCRYLFSDLENINETHWDKVYEEVVDDLSSTKKDNKEKRVRIYDAVREINRKVNQQINTDKKLLDWDEGKIEISY